MGIHIMLRFMILLVIAGCVCIADYLWYVSSCQFSPKNIAKPLWEHSSSVCDRSFLPILSQPYRFIGEGKHCYAFVSEDQKYVIKFLKSIHLNRKKWAQKGGIMRHIHKTPPFKVLTWRNQLIDTAKRYEMAQEKIPGLSGLIFTHFYASKDLPLFTACCKGKVSAVDLNQSSFIMQYKAQPTKERIDDLIGRGDVSQAANALIQLHELLISRAKEGISDQRQCYSINFGFLQDRAIQIDVGKIYSAQNIAENPSAEIERLTLHLGLWIDKNYSQLNPLFQEYIKKSSSSY